MKGMATTAAIKTIGVKWNTPIGGNPMSVAIPTTRRLVDVPMVVAIPPINTALLTGINVCEAGIPPRAARDTRMGSNNTMTGVSFTIMLRNMASTSVTSRPSWRLNRHTFVSVRAAGSSAPVVTRPRPMIISAQIVTRA